MLFVNLPHGFLDQVWPASEGPLGTLTSILEPLAPFKDRLLLLPGLDNHFVLAGAACHLVHNNTYLSEAHTLAGRAAPREVNEPAPTSDACAWSGLVAGGRSFDVLWGRAARARLPTYVLAMARRTGDGPLRGFSWDKERSYVPASGPKAAAERLRGVLPGTHEWSARLDEIVATAPDDEQAFSRAGYDAALNLELELIRIALASDAAASAVLDFGSAAASPFPSLNAPVSNYHDDFHSYVSGDLAAEGRLAVVQRSIAAKLAAFAEAARKTPHAGETLLDHTVVVWFSSMAGSKKDVHLLNDVGAVMLVPPRLGLRRGQLVRVAARTVAVRDASLGRRPLRRPFVDLLYTLGHALGADLAGFGEPSLAPRPFSDLLAK